jgi:GTP-binding nuclear protein Ran
MSCAESLFGFIECKLTCSSWLARKLVGNQSLDFVAAPALAPPEVQVDQAVLEQYQKEMADAAQMPLPDEDDPDL